MVWEISTYKSKGISSQGVGRLSKIEKNLVNVVKGRPVVFVGMNYYDRWKNKSELRGGWRRFVVRRRQRSVSVVHQVTSRKIQTQ